MRVDQNNIHLWSFRRKKMRLAISSIVFVAAFALVGCEKKVEAPAVVDAGAPEKPACCESTAVDADAAVPVAPLTAPVATAPAAPTGVAVEAPTTTVTK